METKQKDIFISYCRRDIEKVKRIKQEIEAETLAQCWMDLEGIESGNPKFTKMIIRAINSCPIFLFMLSEASQQSENALKELDFAYDKYHEEGKKVVIVYIEPCKMNDEFKFDYQKADTINWQNPLQREKLIRDLKVWTNYEAKLEKSNKEKEQLALTANSIEYSDMAMERLQTRYLQNKRHLPMRKIMKVASIVVTALLAVVGILWGVFMMLSQDVCQKYATTLTKDADHVHLIAETNSYLKKDWEKFNLACSYERKPERMAEMQQSMLDRLDVVEKSLKQTWAVDSVPMDISPYHSFLLSLHGINAEEMAISPQVATLYYKDYLKQLEAMRRAAREPRNIYLRYVDALFEIFGHSINSYYATLLCDLSPFPESSLTTFNEMHKRWTLFPSNYEMGKERSFYEDIVNQESQLAQDALSRYASMLEEQDAQLEDQQFKLDSLETAFGEQLGEQFGEQLRNIHGQLDSTALAIFQGMSEVRYRKKMIKNLQYTTRR